MAADADAGGLVAAPQVAAQDSLWGASEEDMRMVGLKADTQDLDEVAPGILAMWAEDPNDTRGVDAEPAAGEWGY